MSLDPLETGKKIHCAFHKYTKYIDGNNNVNRVICFLGKIELSCAYIYAIAMKTLQSLFTLSALSICLSVHLLQAQVTIVQQSTPQGRIVINPSVQEDHTAALLLQDFVYKISQAKIPIVHAKKAQKGDVFIGNTNPFAKSSLDIEQITEDGFGLECQEGILWITGKDKGTIYGVVSLLEQSFGVSYWSADKYTCPQAQDMHVSQLAKIENPAFRYRQSQSYALAQDSIYKLWYRFELPSENFAAGLWVHTFDKLLPAAQYGEQHPEYYSYFNGKRNPGQASQWCLTNEDVFEIVAARIDSIFRAHPDKHMISVSQNDGNYTNCTCASCHEIDEREGALSGSLIHFMNKLATRFPDKEFSTLAYLYTMHPPKHIKPLPNVNIMLCNIDCHREVSLRENASGQEFMKALEGWSAISNNIFLWDYGINFDNYLSPFPNLHILQDNIQIFRDHHVNMHFSQIAGAWGGNFSELRAYLVSKLMWNPDADVDSLTNTFLKGYYGAAAPYLYQYIKTMEGALLAGEASLWIYDSPVTHKDGMLNDHLMKRYKILFDKAEKAVANDASALAHVQLARLPIQYSELEITRARGITDPAQTQQDLALFEERIQHFKVKTLNERSNSPLEYCELYRLRYMPKEEKSLAHQAAVSYLEKPSERYVELGKTALTDGLMGGSSFVESWVGWEGKDGSFVIDLGRICTFHTIETDFLHQLGQWILLPKEVQYSISENGQDYALVEKLSLDEDRSVQVKYVPVTSQSHKPITARYIKVDIKGTKVCPHWHYGVGHPSWFFIDEVRVF